MRVRVGGKTKMREESRERRERGSCRRRLVEYDDEREVEVEVEEEEESVKTVVNGMMSMMQTILMKESCG